MFNADPTTLSAAAAYAELYRESDIAQEALNGVLAQSPELALVRNWNGGQPALVIAESFVVRPTDGVQHLRGDPYWSVELNHDGEQLTDTPFSSARRAIDFCVMRYVADAMARARPIDTVLRPNPAGRPDPARGQRLRLVERAD